MNQRNALIVGGSMAGLFTANMLHRAGWDVVILERATTPLSGRGTGIVTHAGMLALLRRAGVTTDASLGVPLTRRLSFDKQGRITAHTAFSQILMGWSRLHALLVDALPAHCYQLNRGVAEVAFGTTSARARAICHDGETVEADVLIGADGVRSLVRGVMLPNEHLETAPYIAWRGLVRQSHLTASAQAQLGDAFVVVHEPNEELVTYPVLGDDGHVYINIVWYRRVSDAQRRQLFTDEAGAYHPQGISPLAIRPGFVAQAKADASAIFHPHLAEAIALAPEFLLQVIVDQTAPVMAVGRTALVGDAAFVARPHVGQGVTKAGGDAWALTQFLEAGQDDVVGALAQYSASRVPVGKRAVSRARELGAVLMPDERSLSEWSTHYSDAQNLLVDTAVELPGLAHISVMDEGVT